MGKICLGSAIAVGCGLAVQGAGAQETRTPDYRFMLLKSQGEAVQATLGNHCHPDAVNSGKCVEVDYPLKTNAVLKLRPGATVTLLFRADAGDVKWRAARIDGRRQERLTATGEAKPATRKTKRRWIITLPKRLSRSTDLLGFDIVYPNAYSSFEVGAKMLP